MAIDVNKIIQAAAEAALEGQSPGQQQPPKQTKRKGLTAPKALVLGAGVYTAGRLLVRARSGGLLENLQDRVGDLEHRFLGGDLIGGDEDEGYEDEEFEDEEPEGEYDEDEEPEGEYDEDEEPEGEYEEEEPEEEERPRRRRTSSAGSRNGRN